MRRIRCAMCKQSFSRITKRHTENMHDMSIEQYREQYGPTSSEEAAAIVSTFAGGPQELFQAAARGMAPEEVSDMQANARLRVFSRQKRHAAIYASFGLMQMRMEHFKKSAELVSKIQEKLCDEEWRLEVDPDGKAISTKDLLEIGRYAQTDMKNVGEIFMRLMGQVVQDNKAVVTRPGAVEHAAFSGEHDQIPMPDVPGAEREKIRVLLERFVTTVTRERVIPAQEEPVVIEGEVRRAGEED